MIEKRIYFPLLILASILAGCASQPERVVEVKVPIQTFVPCPVTLPAKPTVCTPKEDTRPEVLRCMLVEREQLRAYSMELEAQLRVCAE